MKRGDKVFWVSFLIGLAITIIIVIAISIPSYSEETKDILSPVNYKIINKVDGVFLKLPSYDNPDASKMEFNNLKKKYNTVFANETFSIFILENATVVYQWDYHGEIFISQNDYLGSNPKRNGNVIDASGGNPITIKIAWSISPLIVLFVVMGICVSVLVSIGIGRSADNTFFK